MKVLNFRGVVATLYVLRHHPALGHAGADHRARCGERLEGVDPELPEERPHRGGLDVEAPNRLPAPDDSPGGRILHDHVETLHRRLMQTRLPQGDDGVPEDAQ